MSNERPIQSNQLSESALDSSEDLNSEQTPLLNIRLSLIEVAIPMMSKVILFSLVLIIFLYIIAPLESFSEFFIFDLFYYILIIEMIAFIYLGLVLRQIPWVLEDYRGKGRVGLISGLILGFVLALFKLVWYHKLWTIFNLVTEPITTGIIGFLVVGLVGKIRSRK